MRKIVTAVQSLLSFLRVYKTRNSRITIRNTPMIALTNIYPRLPRRSRKMNRARVKVEPAYSSHALRDHGLLRAESSPIVPMISMRE